MAHFRISHLIVGKSDSGAAGLNQGMGVSMPEGIHHRRAGHADRVVIRFGPVSPAVKDGEDDRCDGSVQSPDRTWPGVMSRGCGTGGWNSCHPINRSVMHLSPANLQGVRP